MASAIRRDSTGGAMTSAVPPMTRVGTSRRGSSRVRSSPAARAVASAGGAHVAACEHLAVQLDPARSRGATEPDPGEQHPESGPVHQAGADRRCWLTRSATHRKLPRRRDAGLGQRGEQHDAPDSLRDDVGMLEGERLDRDRRPTIEWPTRMASRQVELLGTRRIFGWRGWRWMAARPSVDSPCPRWSNANDPDAPRRAGLGTGLTQDPWTMMLTPCGTAPAGRRPGSRCRCSRRQARERARLSNSSCPSCPASGPGAAEGPSAARSAAGGGRRPPPTTPAVMPATLRIVRGALIRVPRGRGARCRLTDIVRDGAEVLGHSVAVTVRRPGWPAGTPRRRPRPGRRRLDHEPGPSSPARDRYRCPADEDLAAAGPEVAGHGRRRTRPDGDRDPPPRGAACTASP